MNFTTPIPIPKTKYPIDYNSKIILLGSCFSENIGEKFEYFKFQNTINPFGIIFNPISIEKLVSRVINQEQFTDQDIFFHNERWHCFNVHSDLSHANKDVFLENLNTILAGFYNQIQSASHCIFTYGTSWVYRLKSSNEIVANCHKVSQKEFSKEILSVESIEKSIQNTAALLQKVNPNLHLIFTISPVRHIKDGFVENQRSKSHLITALHSPNFQLPTSTYFPSYEIMMDELRDYRFYAEDMLHPSQVAINYIWSCFKQTSISEISFPVMDEVETIQKGMAHRPFNINSESYQQFLSKLQVKMSLIQKQFPEIRFFRKE